MKRKIFIFFLVLVVSKGTMFAVSGACGDSLTWDLTDGTLVISGTGAMTDWSSTSATPWYSYKNNITSVIIGDSVTSIGKYAFSHCLLTNVNIGNSVISIGNYAFYSSYLTAVSIPNNVASLGSHAFEKCYSLTFVNIGNGVTSIGCYAFSDCSSLTSVEVLGETPARLGCGSTSEKPNVIFKDCVQLSDIYVPCGTIDAYKHAFAWSAYSYKIKYHSLEHTITGKVNDTKQGTVIVPTTICDDSLIAIPNYGYHFVQWSDGNTDNPRSIELTQDTTFTAEFALNRSGRCGNDSLLTWQYDPTTKTLAISGNGAFIENVQCGIEARPALEKIIIGEGVTAINTEALADCPNLTSIEWNAINGGDYTMCPFPATVSSVTFGANVEHIPAHLCHGKNTMNSLVFPSSLKSIGEYAFKDWTNIKQINIPNKVKTIGEHAFDSCIYVTSIYLGHEITEIGNYAFKGCIRVNDITCMNTITPVVYSSTLTSISPFAYLYVPEGSKRTYQIDRYWGRFDIREIVSKETTVTKDGVIIETNDDNAKFSWPTEPNAATYSLQITKDGAVFCTLVFNASGQLISIAFAPSKKKQSPSSATTTSISGMSFTITGLSSASKYAYNIVVCDENQNVLVSYRGEFATTGYAGEVDYGGSPERPEGIDNTPERESPYTKVLINGHIYILMPNGQKYSIMGNQIK